jgi:N-acetylneuraminic acid mutarotase
MAAVAASLLVCTALGVLAPPAAAATITFTPANPMNKARAFFTANDLPNGNILVAGGYDGSCQCAPNFPDSEIFNWQTGLWTVTTPMNSARAAAVSVGVPHGRVMVIGGFDENFNVLASAEIYDPGTSTWTLTAPMITARVEDFVAVVLNNNAGGHRGKSDTRVLVAGGTASDGVTSLAAAEIYDENSNTWTATGSMNVGRGEFNSVELLDGRVLAVGGVTSDDKPISSAEIYDPATGIWTLTGSMRKARNDLQLALLPDGRVLAAGGGTGSEEKHRLRSAEIFDPNAGQWTATGAMTEPRSETERGTVMLSGGHVLVTGGLVAPHTAIASSDLYDPTTGKWKAGGYMSEPRSAQAALVEPGNRKMVIVMGGLDQGAAATASADIGQLH